MPMYRVRISTPNRPGSLLIEALMALVVGAALMAVIASTALWAWDLLAERTERYQSEARASTALAALAQDLEQAPVRDLQILPEGELSVYLEDGSTWIYEVKDNRLRKLSGIETLTLATGISAITFQFDAAQALLHVTIHSGPESPTILEGQIHLRRFPGLIVGELVSIQPQFLGTDTVQLKITTNLDSRLDIAYQDRAKKMQQSVLTTSQFRTSHELTLKGLLPGTIYDLDINIVSPEGRTRSERFAIATLQPLTTVNAIHPDHALIEDNPQALAIGIDGQVAAVYQQSLTGSQSLATVLSRDRGRTWQVLPSPDQQRLAAAFGQNEISKPRVIVDDEGRLHLALVGKDSSGNFGIYWFCWRDAAWGACEDRFAPDTGGAIHLIDSGPGNVSNLLLADGGESIYAVWNREGSMAIEISRLSNESYRWSVPHVLSRQNSILNLAAETDVKGLLHVLWLEETQSGPKLYHALFDGTEWSPAFQVGNGSDTAALALVIDPANRLHALWFERNPNDRDRITHSVFTAAGWSEPVVLSTAGTMEAYTTLGASATPNGIAALVTAWDSAQKVTRLLRLGYDVRSHGWTMHVLDTFPQPIKAMTVSSSLRGQIPQVGYWLQTETPRGYQAYKFGEVYWH